MSRWVGRAFLLVALAVCGCGDDGAPEDGSLPDGARPDGGGVDTGVVDFDPAVTRGRFGENRAPTFISDPPTTGVEGQAYRYAPRVDDLDGDLVEFTLGASPEGMRVSPETGAIYWLVGEQQAGAHAVTLRVEDEAGASAEQSWTIDVTASAAPPRITSEVPGTRATAGAEWVYAATAEDPDGEALTWSVAPAPAGMAVDGAGRVTFTPPGPGAYPVTLTVRDPGGLEDAQRFQVVVPDGGDVAGPTVTITSPADGAEISGLVDVIGTVDDATLAEYRVTVCGVDDPGNCRELRRSSVPVVDGVLGTVDTGSLEPAGYTIRVEATDANMRTGEDEVAVTVPVGTQMGHLRLAFVEMVVQSSSAFVEIIREYDGSVRADGDFGIGWRLTTDVGLPEGEAPIEPAIELPATPIQLGWDLSPPSGLPPTSELVGDPRPIGFTLPDGREYVVFFTPEVTSCITGGCYVAEGWTSTTFGVDVATRDGGGRAYGGLFLTRGSDTLQREDLSAVFDPQRFELTTEFGETYRFSRTGLISYRDAEGMEHTWTGASGGGAAIEELIDVRRDAAGHVTRIVDRFFGDAVEYEYSPAGDLATVRYVGGTYDGETQTFVYDDDHVMTSYDAPGQRLAEVEYDDQGRVVRVTDGTGSVTEYVYEGDVKRVITPSGAEYRFEHDARGNVTAVQDPMGQRTALGYDGEGRNTSIQSPRGGMTVRGYDPRGNLTLERDPAGVERRATFDAEDRITAFSTAPGREHTVEYGGDGGRTMTVRGPDGAMLHSVTYDEQGNATRQTDGRGRTTSSTFDARGREERTELPDGTVLQTSWDERGLVATTTHVATGQTHVTRTDPSGDVREVQLPGGGTITYDWDILGRPRRVVDQDGRTYAFRTDGAGRLSRVDVDGEVIRQVRYDAEGRPVSILDASGRARRIDYDPLGRPVAIHGATGIETREYDADGNLVARVGPEGERVEIAYDMAGRATEVHDSTGAVHRLGYDGSGAPDTITDGMGRVHRLSYDASGNVDGVALPGQGMTRIEHDVRTFAPGDDTEHPIRAVVTPSGDRWEYGYDDDGALATITDPELRVTTHRRGAIGLVEAIELPGGAGEYRFEHDDLRRLTRIVRPSGQDTRFEHGDDDSVTRIASDGTRVTTRVEGETTTHALPDGTELRVARAGGDVVRTESPEASVVYGYDAFGNVASVTTDDGAVARYVYDAEGRPLTVEVEAPSGEVFTTSYVYAGGRLTEMADPSGGVWRYQIDDVHRLTRIERPNGTTSSYTYGELDRPATVTHAGPGGAAIATFAFEYDDSGRVTRLEGPDGAFRYTYDALDRLASEAREGGAAIAWQYDAVGNVTQVVTDGAPTAVTSDADGAVTAVGGEALAVDGRGNRTADRGRALAYDAMDRLASATGGGADVSYGYDARGGLVRRTAGGETTRCLYAPIGFDARPQCLLEYGPAGTRAYAFDPFGVASRHGDGGARYVHRGLHGSVVALTDEAGAEAGRVAYDAWGAVRSRDGEGFRYGYAGEQTDPDTGYVYLRSRWYDPSTRSFLTPDGADAVDRDPRTLHRYAYVPQGAALNLVDPNGTFGLISLNVSISIQSQLRGLRVAALNCARRVAISQITQAVFSQVARLLINSILDQSRLGSAIQSFLGSVVGRIGPAFEGFMGNFLCRAGGAASPPGFNTSIRFEVPISRCGEEVSSAPRVDCNNRGGVAALLPDIERLVPSGGTKVDVLMGDIPMELKAKRILEERDQRQIIKYCRFAAREGGHLVMMLLADWPPAFHATSSATQAKFQRIGLAADCARCWNVNIGTPASPDRCDRSGFGSALVFMGYDRGRRRLRMEIPKIHGLCR